MMENQKIRSFTIKLGIFFMLFIFFRYMGRNLGPMKYITGSLESSLFYVYGYSMLACIFFFIYYLIRITYQLISNKKL